MAQKLGELIDKISIHALREEGDHTPVTVRPSRLPFLSTPSARRATSCPAGCRLSAWISIHALREEGDAEARPAVPDREDFYPRPPRGGRRAFHTSVGELRQISIHALREEGDGVEQHGKMRPMISIHALREEGDGAYPPWRPARCNFYPRPPRGGRRCIGFAPVSSLVFLSTPSARRATGDVCRLHSCADISIHALREEGDWRCLSASFLRGYFYPRPPRGGRPPAMWYRFSLTRFLSTPSARRATASY